MAPDCLAITELTLDLPGDRGTSRSPLKINEKKRGFSVIDGDQNGTAKQENQTLGWPPLCSYRRKTSCYGAYESANMSYVKVRMDGVPFLRKIDLCAHEGYCDLMVALEELFHCFGIGEPLKSTEIIYEDKDGEWMPLGNVPWETFRGSCKRVKIVKETEAKGMGIRAKLRGSQQQGTHNKELQYKEALGCL